VPAARALDRVDGEETDRLLDPIEELGAGLG
jgi:hypothetical protein